MSAIFTDKIRQTTREFFLPKAVDGILEQNPLVEAALSGAERWTGEKMKKAIKVKKSQNGQSYGLHQVALVSSSPDNVRLSLEFAPKFYVQPVTIPFGEMAVNGGSTSEERFLDLAQINIESASQDMADTIGDLFYGVGSSLDFQGLEAIVDDGTNVAVYGSLSRAAYPEALNAGVVPSGGALTLAGMRTAYNEARRGNITPSAIYCTEEIEGFYESLLQPQERIMKSASNRERLVGSTGFSSLMYIGMPVINDNHSVDGNMYFIREKDMNFYSVRDIPQTREVGVAAKQHDPSVYEGMKGLGFRATEWQVLETQTGVSLQIHLGGEMIAWSPRDHAKLTGITSA
jgi:hypothetical protein